LDPELVKESDESLAMAPVFNEPEFEESKEAAPLAESLEPEDESHGVTVVVVTVNVTT